MLHRSVSADWLDPLAKSEHLLCGAVEHITDFSVYFDLIIGAGSKFIMFRNTDRIVFISTMDSVPWGGSEELWSRAALNLVSEGFSVAASVVEWSPLHVRVQRLKESGITVSTRAQFPSLWERARGKIGGSRKGAAVASVEKLIEAMGPGLVVHSSGTAFPYADFVEICLSRNIPFVTISQANHDGWWLDDRLAQRLRPAMLESSRCYFVSDANRQLAEKQLGCELANAEIIRNPFNVDYNAAPPWPPLDGLVRFASVGRLHPPSKGQDLLFEVLALPVWRTRRWQLYLYGEGPMRYTLERLAHRLGIADRIVFAAHATNVEAIWAANHVLVMPSRFEGLPLTMVEAMLCARPVIATDVAGHAEIIDNGVTGFLADSPKVDSLSAALERFWARRHQAEEMGKAAARKIRQLIPADPGRVFSDKLIGLVGSRRRTARRPSMI
jgi:glycosyltransferase involved in cell wall biosynthesis